METRLLATKTHYLVQICVQVKGLNDKEAMDEVRSAKESLKLVEKGSTQSHTLSGGMKRKLSVGIALCAGSKVPRTRVLLFFC